MSRILVVEDDASIRQLIVHVLAEDGYATDQAQDGLAALDQVRDSSPDLIVLDLFMPRMDGAEFLNVCRLIPECASTPVVVVSVSDQLPADRRVRAFLKKPFDVGVLSGTVRSILSTPPQSLAG